VTDRATPKHCDIAQKWAHVVNPWFEKWVSGENTVKGMLAGACEEATSSLRAQLAQRASLGEYTTQDYRNAVENIGDDSFLSLRYEWRDKPHRLVYDLCDALDAAQAQIAALAGELEASNSNHRAQCWIPVSERLPDIGEQVFAFTEQPDGDGARVTVAALHDLNHGGRWDEIGDEVSFLFDVTHWMPLPVPPASDPQKAGGK
jgi:hypothetical protein